MGRRCFTRGGSGGGEAVIRWCEEGGGGFASGEKRDPLQTSSKRKSIQGIEGRERLRQEKTGTKDRNGKGVNY